jgi:hypothetical protein
MMKQLTLSVLLVLFVLFVPCSLAEDKKPKTTYDDHVLPILRDKCLACHNQDKARGGLMAHSFSTLMAGGSSGEVVKPGDPDGSRLYLLAAHKQEPHMPPKSPMIANENLETIRRWIAEGALENTGSKAKPAAKPKLEIGLKSIVKGRPQGPPPMPSPRLSLEPAVRSPRPGAITALSSSPWAPLIAVGSQQQVLLYHADTLDLLGVLPFPEGIPWVLKFSRNGSLLLAGGGRGGKSGKVVVWNVTSGERITEVGDETDCVLGADISADQMQIALGGPGKIIRIFSTTDGKLVREIKKHTDWVTAVEFSPDGVLLATGDRSSGLYVWEAFTGREYFNLRGHTASITDVSWRADSNVLASTSEDATIRLWEMENGGQIKGWGAHGSGTLAVKFTGDGKLVSCGRDRLVKIWDQNGAQQRAFEPLPDVAMRAVASHDTSRVIGGDWSGQLRVWDTADGKALGGLVPNPPTLAEQLELATKELASRETEQTKLVAAAAASQAAAQKAADELALVQKSVSETPSAVKMASDAAAKAKEAVEKAKASVANAQSQVAARDVFAKALAEAAAKVKDASEKAKDNPELRAALQRSQDLAAQASAELTAAQKSVNDLSVAAKTATDQLAKAQQDLNAASAAAAAAPKLTETKAAATKTTAAKAALDKAAADQGAKSLLAIRRRVDRLRAVLVQVRAPAK